MNIKFHNYNCILVKKFYAHGNRVALSLIDEDDGEPIATCTVNLPNESLRDDEVLIKDYSENEGILDCLVKAGVVKDTGKRVCSGYVSIPICQILIEEFKNG